MKDKENDKAPTPEVHAADRAAGVVENLLATADVARVYGKPIRQADVLLIPAAEVVAAAGFGAGFGSGLRAVVGARPRREGGGGGGGGGKAFSRAVAVIEVSPAGVRVRPVVDYTKIALAALTAAGFVWSSWRAMAKPRRGGLWKF